MNFELVKDSIAYKFTNKKKSIYDLDKVVHRDYLDLALVYYVVIHQDDEGYDTLVITRKMFAEWNITEDQLYEIAKNNFDKIFKMHIMGGRGECDLNTMLITTKPKLFGAVYMLNTDFLALVAEMFDDDICIIPSSIHELILLPMEGISVEKMNQTIVEVNKTAVAEEEYLSDHMYRFVRKDNMVIVN